MDTQKKIYYIENFDEKFNQKWDRMIKEIGKSDNVYELGGRRAREFGIDKFIGRGWNKNHQYDKLEYFKIVRTIDGDYVRSVKLHKGTINYYLHNDWNKDEEFSELLNNYRYVENQIKGVEHFLNNNTIDSPYEDVSDVEMEKMKELSKLRYNLFEISDEIEKLKDEKYFIKLLRKYFNQ